MTPQDNIRAFIVRDLAWSGNPQDLTNDFPLLEKRVIDSMGIFKVVDHIESEYGVTIEDSELTPSNFESLNSLADLIATKQAANG